MALYFENPWENTNRIYAGACIYSNDHPPPANNLEDLFNYYSKMVDGYPDNSLSLQCIFITPKQFDGDLPWHATAGGYR